MAEKVTIMVLKVDLQCSRCYKKVKKVLCKFPQIQDQVYDEKANTVTIKVVCCSPEKIRDKICCKGGGAIKSIEIKEPPKPKPPAPAPAPAPKEPEKPKEQPKPQPPAEPEKPKEKPPEPKPAEKPKEPPKPAEKPKEPDPPKPAPPQKAPEPVKVPYPMPVPGYPPGYPVCCCRQCYGGGPCNSYGMPRSCYDGFYGRPVYDSYGGGSGCYVTRCDYYISDENPSGCSIM